MLAPETKMDARSAIAAETAPRVLPYPIFGGPRTFPSLPIPLPPTAAGDRPTVEFTSPTGLRPPTPCACGNARPEPNAADEPAKPRISDIFKEVGRKLLESGSLSPEQAKAVHDIVNCRTETFGYHADVCEQCFFMRIRYNSCGNRHCPTCQGIAKIKWVWRRLGELLPVNYHHAVFTVPSYISKLAAFNRKAIYDRAIA